MNVVSECEFFQAEMTERKKQEEKRQQKQEEILKSRDGNRIEIWISTDGTSSVKKEEDSDDLSALSAVEVLISCNI